MGHLQLVRQPLRLVEDLGHHLGRRLGSGRGAAMPGRAVGGRGSVRREQGDQLGAAGVLGGQGGFEFDQFGDGLGVAERGDLAPAFGVEQVLDPFAFGDLVRVPVGPLPVEQRLDLLTTPFGYTSAVTSTSPPTREATVS